jgi:hypothetical protein
VTLLADKQTGKLTQSDTRFNILLKEGLTRQELPSELLAAIPHPTTTDETMAEHLVDLEITPTRFNVGAWLTLLQKKTPAEIWQWMVEKGLVYDYLIDARQGDSEDKE